MVGIFGIVFTLQAPLYTFPVIVITVVVVVVVPTTVKVDKSHFRECLLETLTEMFGQECVNPLIKGDKMTMTVEGKTVNIDLGILVSDCNTILESMKRF